jgi:hypothetical protein
MGRTAGRIILVTIYTWLLWFVASSAFAERQGVFDMLRLAPTTLPTCAVHGQLRVDTSNNLLKRCNASTTTWEPIATYAGTPANGNLLIGNGSGFTLAGITGTANQVSVTNGAGSITLSTPQNIHTAATPTFAGASLQSGSTTLGTLLGAVDGGGATSFEIPNGAAPTTNAFGQIAADNNAWDTDRGAIQAFDGTANTFLVGTLASDTPSNGQVPTWNTGGTVTWESSLANPMDSEGDLIYGGASGAATKLDSGTSQQWLVSAGAAAPTWTNTVTTGKTIDGSSDEIQLTVEGHATQTSDILLVQKSDSTDLLNVTNVNGTKIRGTTTNDSAAAGFVGEYVETIQSTIVSTTGTGVWRDIANVALTAGEWDVRGCVYIEVSGASLTRAFVTIGTASGNNATGATISESYFEIDPPTSSGDRSFCFTPLRRSISGSQSYYLKCQGTYTVSDIDCRGFISARRVR